MRHTMQRGLTLIELLLYMGLLSIILLVMYQLFAVAGVERIRSIVTDGIQLNADQIVDELQQNIHQATSVDEPLTGLSSSVLRLNGGSIVYQVDVNNALVKTEGGQSAPLTTSEVLVDSITFTHLGPSVESPTIQIEFVLRGQHLVEGGARTETFQTAVTVR